MMSAMKHARIELSSGGVVFRRRSDEIEVLLIKDSYGNWGFPKGHVEADESLAEAALRECREETGLERLTALAPVGSTDWYFRSGSDLVHKYCDYFLLEASVDEVAEPQTGEGIQACVWMGPEEALEQVTYANARQVLTRALEVIRRGD